MRDKKFILTLSCLCVIVACGTAFAEQGKIKSGPYKGPMGPMAAAPDAPDAALFFIVTWWWTPVPVANTTPITVSSSSGRTIAAFRGQRNGSLLRSSRRGLGAVTKVRLAVTNWGICTPTSNKFTVQIYDDACTGFLTIRLGQPCSATSPAAPPALATANFGATGPLLTAGLHYWVVVTTSAAASQNGTTAVWWEANAAIEPFNLNDGNGWHAGASRRPGRFPSAVTSDTDRILNRARADILRELVLFCAMARASQNFDDSQAQRRGFFSTSV